ncbi:hypothetical protein [Puia sp.]|jgi:hypothetical protein|uniref:hypothetical protein n=1 Tax=Puia sp. TaxID=2045100 RepID=UPI002F428498
MDNASGLEQCKRLIEASLGWGDSSSWTNEDFETLSDRIAEKVSVRLSVSTLKRIWGKVKYDSSPTMATLNALARYAGFEGWRDLLAPPPQHPIVQPPTVQPPTVQPPTVQPPATQPPTEPPPTPPRRQRSFITPMIIITLAIAALLSFISARIIHKPSNPGSLRFDHHLTSEALPNSVVFDYDATALNPQKVTIQQSWDPSRREKVDPNGKEHTSIYYFPGFFRAKLIVDGEIKKESDVYIPTKGWKAIIAREPLPVYLSPAETTLDSGRMGIKAATLETKTGSPVFSNRWVSFFDVHEFPGIDGDHFLLRTTFRNTSSVEQSLCRKMQIILMGTENPIVLSFSDKGCISGLTLYTGSRGVNGKDHDLSAFGCDCSQWQQVTCTQENGLLSVLLNGRQIYTVPRNGSIGGIIGLRLAFEGTGEIKEAVLKGRGDPLDLLKQP